MLERYNFATALALGTLWAGPGALTKGMAPPPGLDPVRLTRDEGVNDPDAVHLGTPKRNPVIARSVGEPL